MDPELRENFIALNKKVTDLTDIMRELFLNKTPNNLMNMSVDGTQEFDLLSEIEDLDDFDAILETMNQFGSDAGFAFKKGQVFQTAKTIVCKFYDRNKGKSEKAEKKVEEQRQLIKDIGCKVYYRFSISSDGSVILTKFNQGHNHPPTNCAKRELTPAIKCFMAGKYKKSDKPCDVRDPLEIIFGTRLGYWQVYREFRDLYPRLGINDCRIFLGFLSSNNAPHYEVTDSHSQAACRIYLQTQLMHENYGKFGDIVLTDSTYNTNRYPIPLVIISGIDNNFRNIIYALALVNGEKLGTYSWILRSFFKDNQKPRLVISDSDKSICAAIALGAKDAKHRLCCWHLSRNLRRNFNYIKGESQDLKDKICNLPYYTEKSEFDDVVSEAKKYFEEHSLNKSKDYLNAVLEIKEKWSIAHHEVGFDANITTTSRAESTNAVIKRYLNSKSEVSDLRSFIADFENKYLNFKEDYKTDSILENTPLAKEFKAFLSPRAYRRQMSQFGASFSYESDPESQNNDEEVFLVSNSNFQIVPAKNMHRVTYSTRITCDCPFSIQIGLVCRHVLHICFVKKVKSLERLVILDRWRNTLAETETKHFLPFLFTPVSQIHREREEQKVENRDEEIQFEEKKTESLQFSGVIESESEALEQHNDMQNFEKKENNKGAPKKGNKKRQSQTNEVQALQEELEGIKSALKKVKLTQQENKADNDEKSSSPKPKKVSNTKKKR
jgi:hypothetical protein